jgi:two-component system, OmpR family, sensor histidine kinase ChvG
MASVAEALPRPGLTRWLGFAGRSLVARLALLLLAFLTVPVILYAEFRNAEETKSRLLLEAIRDKGLVIARALKDQLNRADASAYAKLGDELTRYAAGNVGLKLLFRPQTAGDQEAGFFYVAASPPIAADQLARERQLLADLGILERVTASCVGDVAVALRLDQPNGHSELLTSITPVKTAAGCWALIAASSLDTPSDRRLGLPYWRLPEVQLALAVYLGLALLVLALFLDLWRSLHRFGRMARNVGQRRGDAQFTDEITVPELAPVATAFDQMVARLRAAAAHLRQVAEDTAHAYKQPLGTIRQALEPLRRRNGGEEDPRGERAIRAIEASLDRLDSLVAAARRLDDVTADTLDPPRERIDAAALLRQVATSYAQTLPAEGPRLAVDVVTPAEVVGGTELLELALENLVENALSFSPPLATVRLRLTREGRYAVVTVEDSGPGVPSDILPRIFDRYFSQRPTGHTTHFGLGLWIVKRNVEAMGGQVTAANRPAGGFAISIRLPVA